MDVTLQAHEAKLVFPVPQGLRELASDISREVLREQPSNIYGFMADYCAALLRTRDNCIAAADIVSQLLDRDITFAAMLERKGLRLEDAHHAAIVIQSAFRGHRERQRVKTMDVDAHFARIEAKKKAANVIQAAFRGYRTRETIRSIEKYDDVYRSPIIEAMLLRTGHSWNEAQSAAMSIQRAYRAFKVRQAFAAGSAVIKPMDVIQGILEATKHTLPEASVAAVAIQRIFRGYAARKYVEQLKRDIFTEKILQKYDISKDQAINACILIQKIFRGYSVRKAYKNRFQEKTQEATQDTSQETTQEAEEESEEEPAEETAQETAQETPQEPLQETAQETPHETPQETPQETAQESAQETAEETAEETAAETAEETAQETE